MAARKLTDEQVAAIRRADDLSDRDLAREFGISSPTVRFVRMGVTYRDEPTPRRMTPGGGAAKFRRRDHRS